MAARRLVERHGGPYDLPVTDPIAELHVPVDGVEDEISAEVSDDRPADAGELRSEQVRER
jgi:hypothetical protein